MDACCSIRVNYVFLHFLFKLKWHSYIGDIFLCSSLVLDLEACVLRTLPFDLVV
jgi:hypothetical protein